MGVRSEQGRWSLGEGWMTRPSRAGLRGRSQRTLDGERTRGRAIGLARAHRLGLQAACDRERRGLGGGECRFQRPRDASKECRNLGSRGTARLRRKKNGAEGYRSLYLPQIFGRPKGRCCKADALPSIGRGWVSISCEGMAIAVIVAFYSLELQPLVEQRDSIRGPSRVKRSKH